MPNHGGNLLTFFELSMMHPLLWIEKEREKERVVVKEKGCWGCSYVCLSCCFDVGLIHIMGQEVPQLSLFMMPLLLTMIAKLVLFPKLSIHGVGTCIQGAWDIQLFLYQAH